MASIFTSNVILSHKRYVRKEKALGMEQAVRKMPPSTPPAPVLKPRLPRTWRPSPPANKKEARFHHHRKRRTPVRPARGSSGEAALLVLGLLPVRQDLLPHDEDKHGQHHVQPHHCDDRRVKATVVRRH